MKTAADVMTRQVLDIEADVTVVEAIEKMRKWNVSSLLIRRQGSDPHWGFVTQTDVLEKVIARGLDPKSVYVREILTKPLITVPPNSSLEDCAALMARADIRRVLVFDGEDVVGIVSGSDVFDAIEL